MFRPKVAGFQNKAKVASFQRCTYGYSRFDLSLTRIPRPPEAATKGKRSVLAADNDVSHAIFLCQCIGPARPALGDRCRCCRCADALFRGRSLCLELLRFRAGSKMPSYYCSVLSIRLASTHFLFSARQNQAVPLSPTSKPGPVVSAKAIWAAICGARLPAGQSTFSPRSRMFPVLQRLLPPAPRIPR